MTRMCKEFGGPIKPSRQRPMFCCQACRLRFNNRRLERGAQIYDLFMSMRYERGLAKLKGVWAIMCRLAMTWREEDMIHREGRKSWQNVTAVIERLPSVIQTTDVTIIQDRTGRGRGASL